MDETTGTTGAENTAPVQDPAAAPPSYADVTNERLTKQFAAAQDRLAKIKAKPVTADTLVEAKAEHKVLSDIAAEMTTRKEAQDAMNAELAQLIDVALPEFGEAPATIAEGIDEAAGAAPAAAVEPEKELVAASAAPSAAQVAAAREPQAAAAKIAAAPKRHAQAWIAAAGMQKHGRVNETVELETLGKALMDHFKVGQGMGKTFHGEHEAILASLPGYTEDMGELLGDHNGRSTNDRLMREAIDAHTAKQAGTPIPAKLAAICDPLDIIREISTPGRSRATPFRDSLPFRGAGRLGFQYTRSLQIDDTIAGLPHSGVGAWSDGDQSGVTDTSSTWKPVYDVTCGTPVETRAQELTWGLRFEESTDLSSPERVADALDALMTREARRSEAYLLRRYDQMSYSFNWGTANLGGIPDAVELISRLYESAIYSQRIDLGTATVALPPGFLTALRIDKVQRGFDNMPEADVLAELKRGLPDGINVVQLRDISDNADLDPDTGLATTVTNEALADSITLSYPAVGASGTALTHDQCQAYRLRLYWPDQFLAFSTGRTDTGVLRSPELIRQNRSIMFGREWVGLAKPGSVPSFLANFTSFMTAGVRMGMIDATGQDCSS